MRAIRTIYGMPLPYEKENSWICRKIGVESTWQLFIEESLKFTHKLINTQKPKHLFKHIKVPRLFRPVSKLFVIDPPRTKRCRRSFFYKAIKQFNELPHALKYTSIKDFKLKIAKRSIREVPND